MKGRAPVSKIMTKNPIRINLTNDVLDAVEIFNERNIHHLPVVCGDHLIGMISKSDIDRISYVNDVSQKHANRAVYEMWDLDQVMTKQVVTVQADDQIRDAAALLAEGKYHALPVLSKDKLEGIVTSTDVIQYLLEQY